MSSLPWGEIFIIIVNTLKFTSFKQYCNVSPSFTMQRKITFFLGFIFFLSFLACSDNTPEKSDDPVLEHHQVIGVSIWDRISTRSEPKRSSSSTTLLSLGESFIYMDSSAIDSAYNNTKFLKVRLSDSSEVWVYDFASVLNAKPAVLTNDVPFYMRPDLLTITEQSLHVMEIIAVVEEWDDWIKVVNEKSEQKGWIKKDVVTYDRIDLALALLAKRKLDEQDSEQKIKNLEDLLKNNPYPNSIFISELQKKLEAERDSLRQRNDKQFREDHNRRRRD